jgi:alpha-amylase/alpha-mannosidase (GH57 family)
MTKSVSLLFGVHAHQPVGKFPSVLEDVHMRCYGPFLRVLHRYPAFSFAIHICGWLLDYMLDCFSDDQGVVEGDGAVRTSVSVNTAVSLHSQPCFSVSQSESGFEKIMQAVVLTFECALTGRADTLEFCIDVA